MYLRNRVTIGQETVFLSDEQDVDELKKAILRAVRAGGDFVDFWLDTRTRLSVLITPGLTVRFEIVEMAIADPSDWDGSFALSDLDFDMGIPDDQFDEVGRYGKSGRFDQYGTVQESVNDEDGMIRTA